MAGARKPTEGGVRYPASENLGVLDGDDAAKAVRKSFFACSAVAGNSRPSKTSGDTSGSKNGARSSAVPRGE